VAFILILDVCAAAPRSVFVSGAAMNPALKGISALTADDLPGKGIAILVFVTPSQIPDLIISRSRPLPVRYHLQAY
jgi:hypothetical protein